MSANGGADRAIIDPGHLRRPFSLTSQPLLRSCLGSRFALRDGSCAIPAMPDRILISGLATASAAGRHSF
jgi:hypothetical protein